MPRDWVIRDQAKIIPELLETVGSHPLIARLLAQSGITNAAAARAFLDPPYYTPSSPFALSGMQVAVDMIRQAIAKDSLIRIWGDFDADGQTSTVVLYEALRALGGKADYRLPGRKEGHGLPVRAVDEAFKDGVSLLVTCDTGIGENVAIERAVILGLQVIVTDHHDLPEMIAPAHVVVNPKMLPGDHPLRELAGVGVAYMLARALLEGSEHAEILEEMLDLVAVGLVADMAIQTGEVRYLIQRGLERETLRPGLRALMAVAGYPQTSIDETTLGYYIGPRLNAAGRLADASLGVALLLARDETEALGLAEQLEELNRDRQARTEALLAETEELLRHDSAMLCKPAIILDGEGWEPGILGLVAGDLAERYGRPTILIAHLPGQPSAGSARSIAGVDIHEAIASQRAYLVREGGHPMAAGFGIEHDRVPAFRDAIWGWLSGIRPHVEPGMSLVVNAQVAWDEVTLDLGREMGRLAPFGQGNPHPVLMISGGTLFGMEDISRRRETAHRHLYLLDDSGRPLQVTWFNAGEVPALGQYVDVAFRLSAGRWYGVEQAQLELVDWRPADVSSKGTIDDLLVGKQLFDWRDKGGTQDLLSDLRNVWGDDLVIWAEGMANPPAESITRAGLSKRHVSALAILTPPAGPDVFLDLLRQVWPDRVYLLPPAPVVELLPNEFIRKITEVLRTALRVSGNSMDMLRVAAQLGVRRAAIVVALYGLEARGKAVLDYDGDGILHAYRSEDAPLDSDFSSEVEAPGERARQLQRVRDQSRDALMYILKETRAYRRAYATQSLQALCGNIKEAI